MQESDIPKLVEGDRGMMEVLRAARSLHLPDWWVGAGFVRNKVWNILQKGDRIPQGDIDVIYFDPTDLSEDRECAYRDRLEEIYPTGMWSVKNQARMHLRNSDSPYISSLDAIAHWPETATAVAVMLNEEGGVIFQAPCGADDLLNMILRPTPVFEKKMDQFLGRLEKKNWVAKWPKVRVMMPDSHASK